MASALDYIIFGHDSGEGRRERRKLLMFNGVLPSHDARFYAQLIDLAPMTAADGGAAPALALVTYDGERMILAAIQPAADNPANLNHHYVFIPAEALPESAAQLEDWLAYLPQASLDINSTLPLLQPPDFQPVDVETRTACLQRILDDIPDGNFEVALSLLGAVLHEKPAIITRYPPDFSGRLALIAGLQALIPGALAARLTFASHAPASCQQPPQLCFADDGDERSNWIYDWGAAPLFADALNHPYIAVLRNLWRGDAASLAEEIQRLARLAETGADAGALGRALERISQRFHIDHHVQTPADNVSTEAIIGILDGAAPPSDASRSQYLQKLLRNALSQRDAAAGKRVAEELEKDSSLEGALSEIFDAMLEDQPDAVYVFIRNRLMDLGIDEAWIPRLQKAARSSLEVAINEGDVGTLAGWLELIAHEPQTYQLHDILREAILRAKRRAYGDSELGIHLILIAVRRAPDIVDALFQDEQLVNALESNVRSALQEPSAASLERLIGERTEHFLLALYHGLQVSDEILVTLPTAKRLWSLNESDQRVNLPAVYRPPAVTRLLATEASHQMTEEALEFLFETIIACDDRKLTLDTTRHLAARDLLFPRLSPALENDAVPLDKALSIMNAVGSVKNAPAQELIDAHFSLLDYYQWEPQTQRLMEALSRVMAKNHEAQITYRHLWRLFAACHELEIEGATRIAMTRLLLQYAKEEDPSALVDGIARVWRQIGMRKALQESVNAWWRNYTHRLNITQLQRLARELDQQRSMETQKHILYSVLAMRRWLHSQDPFELAQSINATYTILEHFSEAFDAAHIQEIDSNTIRRELDEVGAGLSSEQRHILANNLRNLANRITQMAEKRSKPSLIRSDDSIERQLQQGEANPHGSIDMMKWIAGYLDGAHQPSDD